MHHPQDPPWDDADRPSFSVVVPVFNEEENVELLVRRVIPIMEKVGEAFEILFVDDGSTDRTAERLRLVAKKEPRVRVVRFTRNYGQEAAVEALYLNARGKWLIQMDGDLQNPPEEIPRLIEKRDEGFDIVYGVRLSRQDSIFRIAASRGMQWAMRSLMEIELPEDVSTFRLMSAPIARLVAALPERRKFFSALLVWSGASIGIVHVSHSARNAGATHYNFTKLLNHTFDLVVGFSSKPLRYIGAIGFASSLLGFGLGAWTVWRKIFFDYGATGWPSNFAATAFFSGMQLMALSMIGEYIARIYVQAQARPLYNIAERINFHADDNQPQDELARLSARPPRPLANAGITELRVAPGRIARRDGNADMSERPRLAESKEES